MSYAFSLFLLWVKFCSGCFRQFFYLGDKKKWLLVALDSWSFYAVTIVWEFGWMDSVLVVLDKWLPYRGGCFNRFDFICILTGNLRTGLTRSTSQPGYQLIDNTHYGQHMSARLFKIILINKFPHF